MQDEGVDTNGNKVLFSGTDVITGATSNATGTPQELLKRLTMYHS